MVKIGKIVRPHGLKGEVVIKYFSFSSTFPYEKVYIEIEGRMEPFNIQRKKEGNRIILKLEGVDTIDDSEALKGLYLYVERGDLPETGEDEYYWVDIIGLSVEREDGKIIGEVEEIIPVPSADVLVVKGDTEYLIPMHRRFITEIAPSKGRITVKKVKGITSQEDED